MIKSMEKKRKVAREAAYEGVYRVRQAVCLSRLRTWLNERKERSDVFVICTVCAGCLKGVLRSGAWKGGEMS